MKLFQVKNREDSRFQGIVIYTDVIEGDHFGVLAPGMPVIILDEKETQKHFAVTDPIADPELTRYVISWAYVLSPIGLGWVWKTYLVDLTLLE